MEIKSLEELVKPFLGDGTQIVSWDSKNLLPAGENYGSVMLKLDIKVKNNNNEEETVHAVAKTVPPNEFLWEVFNTKVTFKTEIAVYKTILPILNKFGKSKGIDNIMGFFARSLNARISLDPNSDAVDKDAVLILENLKVKGYEVADRFEGFDLESTKLLLRNLAVMHATPIAFKFANPIEFKEKILPYLTWINTFKPEGDMVDSFMKPIREAVNRNPECIPHIPKLEKIMEKLMTMPPATVLEPFATLIHNDLWTNNVMLKIVNGKPEEAVIVDFQIIEYGSPAHDVIFYLYSSVALPVLEKEGVDYFIKYYYEIFIETLKRLECDVEKFTFDELMNQCAIVANDKEFAHVIMMLNPIFTLKGKAKELAELRPDDILVDQDDLHENYYSRLHFTLLDFVKRGWI